jgi:hypothetical protein
VEEGRGARISAGLGLGIGLGAGNEDALDGAVGRVADRDRSRAGRFQSRVAVLLAQSENPLGGAEPVERVDLQQLVDDLAAGVANLGRLGAAPDGRLHLEGDLLRRVVTLVGAFSLLKCRVGLDQVAVEKDLHHRGGGADVDLARVSPAAGSHGKTPVGRRRLRRGAYPHPHGEM